MIRNWPDSPARPPAPTSNNNNNNNNNNNPPTGIVPAIAAPQTRCCVGGRRLASRAGMNTRLAISVHAKLISNSSPVLAVPGWLDNARDPNAVPVVSAENRIALAVALPNG
jgi:hypothetical protein